MRSRQARARASVVTVIIMSLVAWTTSAASAQPDDDLPPDDGAPPSEYEPSPEARTLEVPTVANNLDALAAELPASPPIHNTFPVLGSSRRSCNDSFGDPRSGGRTHLGVDCFAAVGTPLVAVEDGSIRYATPGEPFSCATGGDISGNRVSVRGRSGYVYYYGHLDTILVSTDQHVVRGQVIGTVGRTGNAACSSPHLHFEVKCGENGPPFDGYPWLGVWGTVAPPAGWPSTEGHGAGVVFSGADRQDLFVLECGRAIRQKVWASGLGLSPVWYALDLVTATSDPDAASQGPGWDPQVFVRGADSAIYQLYWNGSYWDVVYLGGVCTSGPTAVYTDPHRLDVFCRGLDGALWQTSWESWRGWTPGWYYVGGIASSDPDAISPGPRSPAQVVVRGYDNSTYLMYWNGSGWGYENLGGVCTSGPSAAYSGPDRLDVYCRGIDMAMWHRSWQRSSGWSPSWTEVGGIFISDPEVSSSGPGTSPQVFGRGMDRRMYQFFRNGPTGTWDYATWGLT